MAGLLDFAQAASNSAAGNVAGPIDMLAWGLRKMGLPIPNDPVLGTEWMKQKGLIKEVPQSPASLAGETLGLLSPIVAAAKAPQIAGGLLQMGDNLSTAKTLGSGPGGGQKGAIVYHGSPHKFDKFDSSKIGTGEGAQAYGHGLYLAENPKVAQGYQEKLSDAIYKVDGAAMPGNSDAVIVATEIQSRGAQGAKSYLLAEAEKAASLASESGSKKMAANADNFRKWAGLVDEVSARQFAIEQGGSLYKVDLPDEHIAKFLDWDKPLSQQAPEVQKAIKTYKGADWWIVNKDRVTGAKLTREIEGGNPADFSSALADMSVPGIRYLDGGSRGAGQGTSNFVVFAGNEDILKILERNGVPLK